MRLAVQMLHATAVVRTYSVLPVNNAMEQFYLDCDSGQWS